MSAIRLLAADPPWRFDNAGTRGKAENHYATMSVEEICDLGTDLQELCAPDALLFLWVPSALLLEGVGTRVARAWGFEPKQIFVWEKNKIGLGNYFRNAHEPAILATRGRAAPMIEDKSIRNIVQAARGRHSEKPEIVYDLLDRLVPPKPNGAPDRLELFARRVRPGWICLGDELPNGGELNHRKGETE